MTKGRAGNKRIHIIKPRLSGSAFKVQPLARKAASLIEKETLKKRISNTE